MLGHYHTDIETTLLTCVSLIVRVNLVSGQGQYIELNSFICVIVNKNKRY